MIKSIKKIPLVFTIMEGLSLKIPIKRKCSLDGLILHEPVDINLLNKCINSDLLVTSYNDDKWFKNEKQQLNKYAKNITRNLAQVEYRRKDGFEIGRVNPVGSLGLHSITRRTRSTLVNGLMRDVDIVNCHFVLLQQVLVHNNYNGSYKNVSLV